MTNFVHHGSPVQNLTEIIPQKEHLVFAAKNRVLAALFTMQSQFFHVRFGRKIGGGTDKTKPYIIERYKSAFDKIYNNKKASLYVLSADSFDDSGPAVVTSQHPQKVIQEIKIDNLAEYLLDAEKNGQLKIYRYPSRPSWILQDDSDLIEAILNFPRKLQEFKELFPDLYLKNKDKFENIENN